MPFEREIKEDKNTINHYYNNNKSDKTKPKSAQITSLSSGNKKQQRRSSSQIMKASIGNKNNSVQVKTVQATTLFDEQDDMYEELQDSVNNFGERVKKLDSYLNSLEKQLFIYNNDIENINGNNYYYEKNTKLTNFDENLLDYLKPILN
jgi:hypothetical protein